MPGWSKSGWHDSSALGLCHDPFRPQPTPCTSPRTDSRVASRLRAAGTVQAEQVVRHLAYLRRGRSPPSLARLHEQHHHDNNRESKLSLIGEVRPHTLSRGENDKGLSKSQA